MRLALIMHSPLGAAFQDCADHILGVKPVLQCFDILPDANPDHEIKIINDWIYQYDKDQEIIFLCDLYGATPFNIAVKARDLAMSDGYNVKLLTGANMCMLLKALTESADDLSVLMDEIYHGAKRGIVNIDTI